MLSSLAVLAIVALSALATFGSNLVGRFPVVYRKFSPRKQTIAATTAQTLTWTGDDLPAGGIRRLFVKLNGHADNKFGNITWLTVKYGTEPLVSCDPLALAQLLARYTLGNNSPAAADTEFYIPFFDMEAGGMADKCVLGIPLGQRVTVEITTNASVQAGTAELGWELSPITPQFTPIILSVPMGLPAGSSSNAKVPYTLPKGDVLRGLVFNTVGVDQVELWAGGIFHFDLLPAYLKQMEKDEYTATITDLMAVSIDPVVLGTDDLNEIAFITNASWVGLSTNKLTMYKWAKLDERGRLGRARQDVV